MMNDFMYNPYNNAEITDIAPAQTTCCGSITSSSAVLIGGGYTNERNRM